MTVLFRLWHHGLGTTSISRARLRFEEFVEE